MKGAAGFPSDDGGHDPSSPIPTLDHPDPHANPRLYPDYPEEEGLKATERYVKLVPLDPFYRIHFHDGTHFDYKDDREHLPS